MDKKKSNRMKIDALTIILLSLIIISCRNMEDGKNRNEYTSISTATSKKEMVIPPRPGFSSPFKSIAEWLDYLTDHNTPAVPIAEFRFDLYESPEYPMISLGGYNHIVDNGVPTTKVDFKPGEHMFFALPKDGYGSLAGEDLKSRIVKELKEYINSERFNQSFLSKGFYINTSFAGEIWMK